MVDKANIQEENIQQIEVNISPNPFKRNFNLNIHLTQSDAFSLMIFNARGQLIYTQNGQLDIGKHQLNVPINQANGKAKTVQYDMTKFEAGIYIFQFRFEDDTMETIRVMKQ